MNDAHLRSLDLNLLVVLDALLAEGNVTRAATKLGLSQSAVSHALRRLRRALGDPLFERTPGGIAPTPRARDLALPLRRTLEQLQGLVQPPRTFDPKSAQRTFAIGAPDVAHAMILPLLLAYLAEEAPGLRVTARPWPEDVPRALEDQTVDLAVGILQRPAERMHVEPLCEETAVCMVRDGHPKIAKRLTLEAYVSLGHVEAAPGSAPSRLLDERVARLGHTRWIALTVPHVFVAAAVVATTDLLMTLGEREAKVFARVLPLRVIPLPVPMDSVPIAQHWHERHHTDPAHAWLRTVIRDVCAPATK